MMANNDCCSNKSSAKINVNIGFKPKPKQLIFISRDYWYAFLSWINMFHTHRSVEPGLYYTGNSYDISTPMLVTANYHLTAFLLWRTLKGRNVRILVIDTKGINVWCSSGKGQFNVEQIMLQLERYSHNDLTDTDELQIILPKLSLSGISLKEASLAGLKPVIGPIYRQDIPKFLENKPYKDCAENKYRFNLRDRLFTLPASLIQFGKYMFKGVVPLFIWHAFFPTGIHWQPIALGIFIGFLFITLFPLIPGRRFGTKGIVLGITLASLQYYSSDHIFQFIEQLGYTLAILGLSILFALYYTGNSGASNYSLVKKDIIALLPVSALLILGAYITVMIIGVTP